MNSMNRSAQILNKSLTQALTRFPAIVPLLGGLLMAIGPAPVNGWLFPWVAIAFLWFAVLKGRSPIKSGLLWGAAYHGVSLFWITGLHPLTWMGIPYVNSVAIVAVIWGLVTLWGALSVALWAWGLGWLVRNQHISSWLRVLAATAFWCAIESVRSLSPLDWTGIAYTQSPGNLAILHLGQLSGSALITAAIVAVNGTIAESLRSPQNWGLGAVRQEFRNQRWFAFLPAIGLFTISHLIGLGLSFTASSDLQASGQTPVEPIRIGTVQGNIPTRIKLSPPGIRQGFKNYGEGYEQLASQGAQMVLFPEGSLPLDWADYPNNPIAQLVKTVKTPLIVGAFGNQGTRSTQALLMLDDRGQIASQYDKVKVVPLGEALPFEDVLGKFIGRLSPIKAFLVAGKPDQIFTTPFGPAAIGICYESAFPELFRRQVQQGATFLITASNLDPYSTVLMAQHEAHDVMRAIETDRNLIRVTNTGYSGLIQSTGQRKWRSQPQSYDLHLSEVFPRKTETLYVRYGNWITPLLCLLSVGAMIVSKRSSPPKLGG
jgi:apolipoprotein N-acyltransferase